MNSLLVKLLALSAVVSLLSIAATAWLAVRTTTRAIRQEQGQALTDDARIYGALLGYAATHPDWTGVGSLVPGPGREDRPPDRADRPGPHPDRRLGRRRPARACLGRRRPARACLGHRRPARRGRGAGWRRPEDGVVPLDRDLMSSLLEEALLVQHVVDDLQDLSAADAGELRLHPRPLDLADLLPAVVEAFAESADRAGVALAVRAPQALVTADPIGLRQAVGNLVANAIRHTPVGGRVTVSARTEAEGQVIDVADTGPGSSAAEQDLVFERFWRAEKSPGQPTGGSGLGLSIVRRLVEAHGGTVTVRSEPGAGATFTLRLPRESGWPGLEEWHRSETPKGLTGP